MKRTSKRTRTGPASLALALLSSSAAASFLSSPFDSLRPRNLLARSTPSTANASTSSPTVVASTTSSTGRFGHSAVYLPPPTNQILLFGGQVGDNGTQITSSVLRFDAASTFLWGDRPVSAIPDNPAVDATLSSGFPATAWAASALDEQERTWIVGGVTDSCQEPMAHVLNGSSWSTPTLSPRVPPRRRQASAVAVANLTTQGTDVWVFGGIAEAYTCSSETIGYVGIDRYDTALDTVESMAWAAPINATSDWEAPVSDYTATLLDDGSSIAIVGGQTAQGELAGMDQVLVFNVDLRNWYQKTVSGSVPTSRMGHTAVPLSSGSILIHGGLSSNHSPLADLHLLTPPPVTSLSEFSTSSDPWTWTTLEISDDSMTSPSLAWHTATQIVGDTIVVAFGIDSITGEPSSNFWFLTVDESAGMYSWTDTFDGNAGAVANAQATATVNSTSLVRRFAKKQLEVIVNPKMSTAVSRAYAPSETYAYADSASWTGAEETYDTAAAAAAASTSSYIPASASSRSSSTPAAIASATPDNKQNTSSSSSDKTTTIAASLGAIGGAVALLGVAAFLLRRRAARRGEFSVPTTLVMGSTGNGGNGTAPLVSTLMYTRPVQRRMLSLGSTISAVAPSEADSLPSSETATIGRGRGGRDAADQLGASQDPFSDDFTVNELGQLQRSNTSSTMRSLAGALKNSVQSIPFLSTVSRTSDPSSPSAAFAGAASSSSVSPSLPAQASDVYTARAPTLVSRRSLRRPSSQLPSMPVPGTPAELIGLAVTSDDGHDGGLSYLSSPEVPAGQATRSAAGGRGRGQGEPWETFLEKHGNERPTTSAAPEVGGIPNILRPGTPLRVVNVDPFADQ
ncbi:hypothetical protein JCM1840_003844 [Sporobolomyces johnsonii]